MSGTPAADGAEAPADEPKVDWPRASSKRRRTALVVAVILIAVGIITAGYYFETRSTGPNAVTVSGANIETSYTNAPVGTTSLNAFLYLFAWANATAESPSATSIQSPPGGAVRFLLAVQETYDEGVRGPLNCSVNSVAVESPFVLTSLQGSIAGGAWTAHPFPLNFSSPIVYESPTDALDLNLTVPSQAGTYTPNFGVNATCEHYGESGSAPSPLGGLPTVVAQSSPWMARPTRALARPALTT
jgi:hypothetical protein